MPIVEQFFSGVKGRKRYAPCHHLTVFSYLFENCCNLFPSFPLHARHSTALQSKKLLLSCSFPAESHLRSGHEPASRVHFREITSESIFYCKGYFQYVSPIMCLAHF